MPPASRALLLLPLLQCLHFPLSGPCPQSPFSLLTPLPSLFPISLLTSLPSLLWPPSSPRSACPEPVEGRGPSGNHRCRRNLLPRSRCTPRSPNLRFPVHAEPVEPLPFSIPTYPAGNPTPSPKALTTRSATSSRRPRPGPSTTASSPRRACPELAEGRGPSGIQPPGRFQLPRPPLHTERTALFLPYPRAHRPRPFSPIWTGPNTPQNRQKNAPLHLKSFLEKTLTAREAPNSPPPKAARSQTPHHSGSASSSLALWVRVGACPGRDPGVTVFRSKRCPAAPAGASTPIRRRPTVPNPAHLAATTGDNRMADPLPRRTR